MNFKKQREEMIKNQIFSRGITDREILKAFNQVPREEFVGKEYRDITYSDQPLPIDYGVTISQPYIVALMCQILDVNKSDKILDIGTGSGYQAAILSHLCKKVVSIERIRELSDNARVRLSNLGYENIEVIYGDGFKGYEKESPYDGIVSAASTEEIPKSWKEQLKLNGRIVFPESKNGVQRLVEIVKKENGFEKFYHGYVRFVPLVRE